MADPCFYVGVEGNSFDVIDVTHQINASSRAVIGFGNNEYGGAVSELAVLSRDATGMFLSISSGVGQRTAGMDLVAPYELAGPQDNSHWVYAAAWNSASAVRCYMGYSEFIDLRGPVSLDVNLGAFIGGAPYTGSRILCRIGTPHVFVGNTGHEGVARVNTLTGAVDPVLGVGERLRAIYYSEESDTLYVDSSAIAGPNSVTAYDGETLTAGATYTSGGAATGHENGHTIHIGGEVFIGSEATSAPSGHMWKANFASAPGVISEFGSGTVMDRDPATGYIWSPWRTGSGVTTPEGGAVALDGTYVLVYDPISETLIDAILLGPTSADLMSIVYFREQTVAEPVALPVPQSITTAPMPRAMLGTADRPRSARAIQIDESWTEQVTWPPFTEAQYTAYKFWWETTLAYGGRWFTASWPSPRGQIPLLRRFLSRPSWAFIGGKGGGYWQVSAMIEVRGQSRTAAGIAQDFYALREDNGFILREDGGFVERE